jgi:autotransporter adhesin
MAAAFSALVPNHKATGKSQVAVGAGYFEGEGAFAAGLFHNFSDNVLFNAGVSSSLSEFEVAGRVGLTIGF